jgi:hypothetical protein
MPRASRASLEQLELHLWPRVGDGPSVDLSLSRSRDKGRGAPVIGDLGLLCSVDGAASARSLRVPGADAGWSVGQSAIEAHFDDEARVRLGIETIYHRAGLVFGIASGELSALGRELRFEGALILASERGAARRPYAWARATLRGEIDGAPLLCVVETARRRAGSVVLPELGRLWLLGPGARALPPGFRLAPLPLRAEYGTGRLRATALGPGTRAQLELDSPASSTGLFEMVDPSGEAAYAHRALGASAILRLSTRRREVAAIQLDGRYEWGARAGDPRVGLRAWRPEARMDPV